MHIWHVVAARHIFIASVAQLLSLLAPSEENWFVHELAGLVVRRGDLKNVGIGELGAKRCHPPQRLIFVLDRGGNEPVFLTIHQ